MKASSIFLERHLYKGYRCKAEWFGDCASVLNLGEVDNLAQVIVNGKPLGVVWHKPYRVDVTTALKPAGTSRNQGDECVGESAHWRSTAECEAIHLYNRKAYKVNSPLVASGLLGGDSFFFFGRVT